MFWHVLRRFVPAIMRELQRPGRLRAYGWMLAGVSLGFIGKALDNIYWSAPWALSFLGDPRGQTWHEAGVYPNIFARQGLGIASAYCHIHASHIAETVDGSALMMSNRILATAVLAGCFVGAVLILARGF